MKKLISIGVALALLTMAVVPGTVAAYELPATYSKVPFAIIQSGLELVGDLLDILGTELGLPAWLDSNLMDPIAGWAGGPLSWTVDMLAWGIALGADIVDEAWVLLDLEVETGFPSVGGILDDIACSLITCFAETECAGNFTPCG